MPMKLNVGLSRKVGEANYGSRGASVHLELEVESALVEDPHRLQDRIRQMFRLARSSVEEELGSNGHASSDECHSNGRGSRRSNGRSATSSQVRAIHAIANRQNLDLTSELQRRFGVDRPDDLSITEASEFIDAIKHPANGNGGRR